MSIFPFIPLEEEESEEEEELILYQELAYDFKANRLLTKGGKYYLVKENEALAIWIYKALQTKRYEFEIYSSSFGQEFNQLIGLSEDKDIIESEIQRLITETIMVNPYIQELTDFEFEHHNGKTMVTFTFISIYGRETYEGEIYTV